MVPTPEWRPTLDQVGSLLRARTRNTLGVEVGTFTPETRPTDTEAERLIDQACSDIISWTGSTIKSCAQDMAGQVAAIGAACLIELSYFPEQINSGQSPYPQLKELYDQRLPQMVNLSRSCDQEGDEDFDPQGPSAPVSAYPQPCGAPYIGLVTRL